MISMLIYPFHDEMTLALTANSQGIMFIVVKQIGLLIVFQSLDSQLIQVLESLILVHY